MFVAYDGKTMVDNPVNAIRLSKTLCKRKYKGFEMISFPQAYDEWFARKKGKADD
jgi:uncharacterized protein (DUF3820 family)